MQKDKSHDFSKAADTYRQNALVQRHMAQSLCNLAGNICGFNFERILEIGSGTGFLTENIVKNFKYNKLVLNDITDNFTGFSDLEFIKGDACSVDFCDRYNLIISNACFQWFCDFESFLHKIKKNIARDGVLVFSSFGEQNCCQFKNIEKTGLNYCDYISSLNACGYEVLDFEEEIQTLYFDSVKDILRHIKSTGAAVSASGVWGAERYKAFEKKYRELFFDDNGFALTYNPVYVIARPR